MMNQRQLVYQLVFIVLGTAYFAFLARGWLKKRRLRRRMVEEGRLPADVGRRVRWGLWLALGAALVACAVADTTLEPSLSNGWRGVVVYGGLFVVVFPIVFIRLRAQHRRLREINASIRGSVSVDDAVARLRARIAAAGDPDGIGGHGIAAMFVNAGRYDEAAAAFRDARKFAPRKAILVAGEGVSLVKAGRGDEAVRVVEEAKAADPVNAGMACAAADVYAERGRMTEAAEQVRQAEELFAAAPAEQPEQYSGWIMECRTKIGEPRGARAFPMIPFSRPQSRPAQE